MQKRICKKMQKKKDRLLEMQKNAKNAFASPRPPPSPVSCQVLSALQALVYQTQANKECLSLTSGDTCCSDHLCSGPPGPLVFRWCAGVPSSPGPPWSDGAQQERRIHTFICHWGQAAGPRGGAHPLCGRTNFKRLRREGGSQRKWKRLNFCSSRPGHKCVNQREFKATPSHPPLLRCRTTIMRLVPCKPTSNEHDGGARQLNAHKSDHKTA